jgi:hypothetical protein
MAPLTICTFLWDDPRYRFNHLFRYGVDHVNRLSRAVRRNLKQEHFFVAVVPQGTKGLDDDIDTVDIWPDLAHMGGCYRRLRAFDRETGLRIGERFCWLDLDTVVTGPLDPLFPEGMPSFKAWQNLHPPTPYCGSMVYMEAGARQQVWDDFHERESPRKAGRLIGTDQAWIGHRLGNKEAVWTERDGVHSFTKHMKANKTSSEPPPGCRIMFFHGPRDPSLSVIQNAHPWIREVWK